MTEHRFYAGAVSLAPLAQGDELTLGPDSAHRIARVLRLRPGDRIAVFGEGREFACELIDSGRQARVRLLAELPAEAQQRRLVLYPALIRPHRFEWLIEKTTEIGVTAIVPILSERCAVRPEEIGAARLDRWRRIAVEAAEQCGRRTIPSIGAPAAYAEALKSACGRFVLAWEGLRTSSTANARPAAERADPVALFVGPEGGWSGAEVDHARAAGAELLGLGANVLRAETAAIVAVALLLLD